MYAPSVARAQILLAVVFSASRCVEGITVAYGPDGPCPTPLPPVVSIFPIHYEAYIGENTVINIYGSNNTIVVKNAPTSLTTDLYGTLTLTSGTVTILPASQTLTSVGSGSSIGSFPPATRSQSDTGATSTLAPLRFGDGLPTGIVDTLPLDQPVVLGAIDAPSTARRLFKRSAAGYKVHIHRKRQESVDSLIVDWFDRFGGRNDCLSASQYTLVNGSLLLNGSPIWKGLRSGASSLTQAGALPPDAVTTRFYFEDGFLKWDSSDIGLGSFSSCDGIPYAYFPQVEYSLPGQCVPVRLGGASAAACRVRVDAGVKSGSNSAAPLATTASDISTIIDSSTISDMSPADSMSFASANGENSGISSSQSDGPVTATTTTSQPGLMSGGSEASMASSSPTDTSDMTTSSTTTLTTIKTMTTTVSVIAPTFTPPTSFSYDTYCAENDGNEIIFNGRFYKIDCGTNLLGENLAIPTGPFVSSSPNNTLIDCVSVCDYYNRVNIGIAANGCAGVTWSQAGPSSGECRAKSGSGYFGMQMINDRTLQAISARFSEIFVPGTDGVGSAPNSTATSGSTASSVSCPAQASAFIRTGFDTGPGLGNYEVYCEYEVSGKDIGMPPFTESNAVSDAFLECIRQCDIWNSVYGDSPYCFGVTFDPISQACKPKGNWNVLYKTSTPATYGAHLLNHGYGPPDPVLCMGQGAGLPGNNSIGAFNYQVITSGSFDYEIECYTGLRGDISVTQSNIDTLEACIALCNLDNQFTAPGSCAGVTLSSDSSKCTVFSSVSSTTNFQLKARSARLISSSYPFISDAFYLLPTPTSATLGLCSASAFAYDAISPQYSNTYANLYENECGRHFNPRQTSQISAIDVGKIVRSLPGIVNNPIANTEDCMKVCDYANHIYDDPASANNNFGKCEVYTFNTVTKECALYGETGGNIVVNATINAGRRIDSGYAIPADRPQVTGYYYGVQYVSANVPTTYTATTYYTATAYPESREAD